MLKNALNGTSKVVRIFRSQRRIKSVLFLILLLAFYLLPRILPKYKNNLKYDKYAVAVKSGKEVAFRRIPAQLLTFLGAINNLILIGESSGKIGKYEMEDVYTHLYDYEQEVNKSSQRIERRGLDEQVEVDENSIGWKSDAHKNFPGLKLLWNRFPNADWYVMIDDDTYLSMENLENYLSQYNPSQPLYIGSPTSFIGCDGVTSWTGGPLFAHGGSGIIISRGAMEKLTPLVPKCIRSYKSCWAGDIKVSLCLRDVGVLMEPVQPFLFNRDPPNSKFGFPDNPCLKPITFHHLLPEQIQKLYDLETSLNAKGRYINYGQIHQDWMVEKEGNVVKGNRPGGDYHHEKMPNLEECKQKCMNDSVCMSFTYTSSQECFLKDSIPGLVNSHDEVTAQFASKYYCKI